MVLAEHVGDGAAGHGDASCEGALELCLLKASQGGAQVLFCKGAQAFGPRPGSADLIEELRDVLAQGDLCMCTLACEHQAAVSAVMKGHKCLNLLSTRDAQHPERLKEGLSTRAGTVVLEGVEAEQIGHARLWLLQVPGLPPLLIFQRLKAEDAGLGAETTPKEGGHLSCQVPQSLRVRSQVAEAMATQVARTQLLDSVPAVIDLGLNQV